MSTGNGCPDCKRWEQRFAELERKFDAVVKQLNATTAKLNATTAKLDATTVKLNETTAKLDVVTAKLAAATKNSANSSKPPSSDIVKPIRPKKPAGKRKKGGQNGHQRTIRPAVPEDELQWLTQYAYEQCPCCGGPVTTDTDNPVTIVQQIEIVSRTETTEHQSLASHCAACDKTHICTIPPEIRKAGLCGVELSSIIGFLKGACHASLATIRKYLRDVYDLKLSRGLLAKVIGKVSQAIAPLYEELFGKLKAERILNIDETGHRDSGKRMWTWCFRGSDFTVFKIDASRGSGVLLDVLGEEFNGIIGCDYFSAYRKYRGLTDCSIQFCFAHLIRELRFLKEHSTGRTHGWCSRLLDAIRDMFGVIHRRDELGDRFDGDLEDAAMEVVTRARLGVPDDKKARNLSARFANDGESYLKFLTTPGLEPTNNVAEQAIRFVVIDRKVTQGSKSESGQRWLERIWTVLATCTTHEKSLLNVLRTSLEHFFRGEPPPPLLPAA